MGAVETNIQQVAVVDQGDEIALTITPSGLQGIPGPTGATGPQGPIGDTGVVAATAPVTYNSTTKTVGVSTNTANGVPTLDSNGQIQSSQLPAIAVTNTSVVADQAAMLALTAEVGDVAVRTDINKSFILSATPATTLANWQELLTPPDTVTSVAGKTGNVTLTASDVGALADTPSISRTGFAAMNDITDPAAGQSTISPTSLEFSDTSGAIAAVTFDGLGLELFSDTDIRLGPASGFNTRIDGPIFDGGANGARGEFAVASFTSDTTLTLTDINAGDYYTVVFSGSTNYVTLPQAASHPGRLYNIKNIGTGFVSVYPYSGEFIDGISSSGNGLSLALQYQSVTVQSTGSRWIIL